MASLTIVSCGSDDECTTTCSTGQILDINCNCVDVTTDPCANVTCDPGFVLTR